jgi:hypothetical protein
MPGCVLHILGEESAPQDILAGLSLRPYSVFRKGDRQFPENPKSTKSFALGGFKCAVSSADGDLKAEIKDTIAFLKEHRSDLALLKSIGTITARYLDFGYYCRLDDQIMVQCEHLPPELLRLCGTLEIGIELSLYPKPLDPRGDTNDSQAGS